MYSWLTILLPILVVVQSHTVPPFSLKGSDSLRVHSHNGPLDEKSFNVLFSNIKALEIRLSNITNFSKDTLKSFTNLEFLRITFSRIEENDDDLFKNCCPTLKTLEIKNWIGFNDKKLAGIGTLPLEKLEILDQDIPELKPDILKGTKLKKLVLVRDNIQIIHPGAFNGLEELKYMLFTGNKFKGIPKESLSPLKSLKVLELVSNGIEKFTTDNLPLLPNLEEFLIIRDILKEVDFTGIEKVAPKLKNVYLIGNVGVKIQKSNGPVVIHNWV
ncbi:hypothetical protein HHI36_000290 [Cryptolaemus montrouzieri]|uniref:Uncharacterized protein n=1 Tax=Cryptolaemus montrouzieri TaxID=559131 RepID=A0ABD2P495_9CUCU